MLFHNRRDNIWMFNSQLHHVFMHCSNFPFERRGAMPICFSDIVRIERHVFTVNFAPVEKKIGYRVLMREGVQRKQVAMDQLVVNDAPNTGRAASVVDDSINEVFNGEGESGDNVPPTADADVGNDLNEGEALMQYETVE